MSENVKHYGDSLEADRLKELYAFMGNCGLEVMLFKEDVLTYVVYSPTLPEMNVAAINEYEAHRRYAEQLQMLIRLGEASIEVRAAEGESKTILALLQGYEYMIQLSKNTGDLAPD